MTGPIAQRLVGWVYRNVIKKILFLQNPERVHRHATALGEKMGRSTAAKTAIKAVFLRDIPEIHQKEFGLEFTSPFGLAAGFDYEARLTQILPAISFGFGTVGTLTARAHEGNAGPMLGRLPRSGSLMVNKGFKNDGAAATLKRLEGMKFDYPVGVSIGKTNTAEHKTQQEGILDVIEGFRAAESSNVQFAYYELNISCPNLAGTVEFYKPEHLEELLKDVEELGLSRPVFIKMPISKTDDEIRKMMDVVVRHPFIKAAILGNLQRDRTDPAFVPEEVNRWQKGNFSGIPCRARSDELVQLVFRGYGTRLKVIGCGGVFSAEDAYRKIRLGASLVQLITGLIFQGPQLIAEMNRDLARLIRRDGYSSITEAVGVDA